MRTIYGLILTMAFCLGAWAADSTIHGLPNGTAPLPADVTIIDREAPPGTWHNYKLPLSSIATTQVITTNYYTFGTNYYYNDTYVSNYFETNILVDATSSNYFATYNYITNTYQTNVTIEQYISNNSYVSNFVTTNIYNDTYTSNYFSTNLFPTTYVYVTNTIGGAFIANNGGEGTNTVLRGNTVITKAYGDGGGLTNLPGGSQVWTNDTSNGNTVLENVDQTANLAWIDYQGGNVIFSTWGGPYDLTSIQGSIWIGNLGPVPSGNTVMIGSTSSITNVDASVVIGGQTLPTSDKYPVFVVAIGPQADSAGYETVSIGNNAYSGTNGVAVGFTAATGDNGVAIGSGQNGYGKTNIILLGHDQLAPSDNSVLIGNASNTFHVGVSAPGEVVTTGRYVGDGSGLTNLTAVQDIIYNNTNIFNVAKGGTLVITNNIHPVDASWSGPTNLISYTNALQNYTTLVPCSITNTANVMAGVGNSCLLCITNSSSTNITVLVPATFKVGIGESNPYTVTNSDLIELWFYEAGGRKTVTARGFH